MNESLPHAVARMRAQGFNEKQIAGQIHAWHGTWTPAQVNSVLKTPSLEPVVKAPPGPLLKGTRPGLLTAGGTDNFLPGLKAPSPRTLGPSALQTLLGGPAEAGSGTPRAHIGDLQRSQKELGKVYRQNHPVGQQIIEGIANTVPGVALAKGIRDNHIGLGAVGNEVVNDITSGLFPLGKAATVLGSLRGFRALRAAHEAATASKAVAPARAAYEARLAADPEGLVKAYERKFGNVVNTDNARELSPHYAASRESRAKHGAEIHEPSSALAKLVYEAKLARKPARDKTVTFSAGGSGAGKSVSLPPLEELKKTHDIVYDTNMNNFSSAVKKIEQALDTERKVEIQYVYRHPTEALTDGMLTRADRVGRVVPVHEHVRTHVGSRVTMGELMDHYNGDPRVKFKLMDNSRGKGNAVHVTGKTPREALGRIPLHSYDEVADEVKAAYAQEHAAGKVPGFVHDALYAADRAAAPAVRLGRAFVPQVAERGRLVGSPDQLGPALPAAARPLTPSAKTAVMSGRAAKDALKTMGTYEKIGAKLDPYFSKSARTAYKAEDKLRKQEQAVRFAKADEILHDRTLTNDERIAGWKNAMRGSLPQINWRGFDELDADAVKAMTDYALNDAPNLLGRDRVRVVEALQNAVNGRVPRPHEQRLLASTFGEDAVKGLAGLASSPYRETIIGALNVPRTLMASMDMSAVLRQGLLISVRHPVIAARNFPEMFRYFGKPLSLNGEEAFQALGAELRSRPNYPLYAKYNLLTGLDHGVGQAEEAFIGANMAEKFTGGKRGLVRASDRAYTGFLDKMRADVFDQLLRDAQNPSGTLLFKGMKPRSIQDEKFLHDLARVISNMSGRGTFNSEKLEAAMPLLNVGLFSPRLIASRVMTLNPLYYKKLDPFARREALAAAFGTFGSIMSVLALAKMSGAKVETNWRSSDFGKIRIGDTRIDIAGGFQPYFHLLGEIVTQQKKSATTGEITSLTHPKYGQPSLLDVGLEFGRNKLAPIPGVIADKASGASAIGAPFSWKNEIKQSFLPLVWQDAKGLYDHPFKGMNGIEAALAGYGLELFGTGVNTYLPHVSKSGSHDPLDGIGGTGSSNPFDGVGSGSSGSSFDGVGP